MPESERKGRSLYGRSKGKRLRAHQAGLVRELLPQLQVELDGSRPVWLEIGFGGGEHLIARAVENPSVDFIGCEPFLNGVAKVLAGVEALGLSNIRLHRGDALALMQTLPDGFLARVYLLYPDPWPKRRQRKRRFVSRESVACLARVLRSGGEVRFATDIDDYAGWTLRHFLDSPDFVWESATAQDWQTPWLGWTPTRYEAKARAGGRSSAYLTFRRR